MNPSITNELEAYYNLNVQLEAKGGPEEDGDLFEELLAKQEQILSTFGLPPAQKYIKPLWEFTNLPLTEESINKLVKRLKKEAEKHLLSPVTTPTEVLAQAQHEQTNAFDVLPELGYITHDYLIFVYQEMLLKGKATPEEVLAEMESVHRLDCYSDLYNL